MHWDFPSAKSVKSRQAWVNDWSLQVEHLQGLSGTGPGVGGVEASLMAIFNSLSNVLVERYTYKTFFQELCLYTNGSTGGNGESGIPNTTSCRVH